MHSKVMHTTLYEARMRWEGTHERGGGAEVESGSGGGRCRRWSHHSGGRRSAHHPSSYCSLQHNTSLLSSVLLFSNYTKLRVWSHNIWLWSHNILLSAKCSYFIATVVKTEMSSCCLRGAALQLRGYVGLTPPPRCTTSHETKVK